MTQTTPKSQRHLKREAKMEKRRGTRIADFNSNRARLLEDLREWSQHDKEKRGVKPVRLREAMKARLFLRRRGEF